MGQNLPKIKRRKDTEILKNREYKRVKSQLRSFKSIQYEIRKFSSERFYNFVLPKNDEKLFMLGDNDQKKKDGSIVKSFSNPNDFTMFRISSSSIFNATRKRSTIQSLTDIRNLRSRFHDPYFSSPTGLIVQFRFRFLETFSHSPKHLESETELFADNIQMVMHRHYTLKIAQKEIKMELNDQINWLIEECNWKITLLEFAIIFNDDTNSILARNYRTEDTHDLILRDSWLINYYFFESINESNKFFFELELEWIRIFSPPRSFNISEMYVDCTFFNDRRKSASLPVYKHRKLFLKYICREQLDILNSKRLADIIVEQKKLFEFTLMGLPSSDFDAVEEDSDAKIMENSTLKVENSGQKTNISSTIADANKAENNIELAQLSLDIRALMKKLDNNISQKFYFVNEYGDNIADVFINISNIQILRTNILFALTKNEYGQ